MRLITLGVAALLATSACGKADQPDKTVSSSAPAAVPADSRARTAALTANAIASKPAAADSILKAGGYTPDGFQKLMYEIAADSTMSAEYSSARVR